MERSGLTTGFDVTLRILTVLNYACGAFFIVLLVASVVASNAIDARFVAKYGTGLDRAAVVATMRFMLAGGLVGVAVVARLFAALRAILASVSMGEPFAAANADRLRIIGWMLLMLQFLDLISGGVTWRLATLGVDVLDWSPSFTGWLAVLVAFVLTRVFATGAAMREELEATV